MKKSIICAMILVFTLSTFATPVMASERNPISRTTLPEDAPIEVRIMVDRLHEIKEMDKSDLSRAEKKELRKEARAIKSALRATGNGIYISVGALLVIIIIILLI